MQVANAFLPTAAHIVCGGLRGTSLLTASNFNAGQNVSNLHFPRHWIYVLLPTAQYNSLSII
jgi:hypothetical protein